MNMQVHSKPSINGNVLTVIILFDYVNSSPSSSQPLQSLLLLLVAQVLPPLSTFGDIPEAQAESV